MSDTVKEGRGVKMFRKSAPKSAPSPNMFSFDQRSLKKSALKVEKG
jgi:hypothetical protein